MFQRRSEKKGRNTHSGLSRRLCAVDLLESRRLLAGGQYEVNHTPHIQLGNAPLVGTPAYEGTDQIEILWQTNTVDEVSSDEFRVEFRPSGQANWQSVPLNEPIRATNIRTVHSSTIRQLDWNKVYDYRVLHLIDGVVDATYDGTFRTRLAAGDDTPFSFASYGDSAENDDGLGYEIVQSRINQLDPDFGLLLGDNFYTDGTHSNSDFRFSPIDNPTGVNWHAEHVDYFSLGNHDVFNRSFGQASRDNFSVPIQQEGVNAYATPPESEPTEHNYSFDYGNVHFVTIDTNSVDTFGLNVERFEPQLDYAIKDLNASDARWKIMFIHHPIFGTAKETADLNGPYFQGMLPQLREAGVDLLMTAHSHSYAWMYPATGFTDDNSDGSISPDEVRVVSDRKHVFQEGSGLVQVVAGSGGRSMHSDEYAEPFTAMGYSLSDVTPPMEFGFAHVEVSADRLRVSYISGETGLIVGDTNGNGQKDYSEDHFGQFAIVSTPALGGDLNGDGQVDVADINALCDEIHSGQHRGEVDLNGDGRVDNGDRDYLIRQILETDYGDANLDGVIDSTDLVDMFRAGEYADSLEDNSTWSTGDFNCDGDFDSSDLVLMFRSGSYTDDAAASRPAGLNAIAAAIAAEESIRLAKERSDP